MIPSVLVRQLKEGLVDYIDTTFPMTNHVFKGSLSRMLNVKNFIFHEPYVSVRLPFRAAEEETVRFEAIELKFKPYLHQQKAFERLTGENGRSTVIATGTGSGKTECFLFPILEYCYRHRGEPGIKALLIYPMNALASDQAKRIAKLIHENPKLRGNVTAGMYVGGHEGHASTMMGEDRIITDHETLLNRPPDILLTNYKMLDYLLVRPKDAALWRDNKPETLKYITVDELHTFDGAQGTDLACLLRRLKARLNVPQGYLCCIGTSATMGSKEKAQYIREYASNVFGEPFEEDSVITEDRLSAIEFFAGHEAEDFSFPTEEQCCKLEALSMESNLDEYLAFAAESWLEGRFDVSNIMSDETRIRIGQQLMKHSFLQQMLEEMGNHYVQIPYLCEKLQGKFPQLSRLSNPSNAIDALLALISHARAGTPGNLRPFLQVHVQFWMRELSRMLARVSEDNIEYALQRDLNEEQAKRYLPVINCRDCGETGWVSILNERSNATMVDLDTFYNLYFDADSKIRMFFPTDGTPSSSETTRGRLCSHCLQVDVGDVSSLCSSCGKKAIPVLIATGNVIKTKTKKGKEKKSFYCPFCRSHDGLSLVGFRTATAISVVISQLYSSKFNDDKKLLAFSDNVQDAAHRAGFFNSRTWRFGLRGAIQRFALEEGEGLPLNEFQDRFVQFWHNKFENDEAFASFFIAPNMTWMRAYERMTETGVLGHDPDARRLMDWIEQRMKYEIMLEYGLNSRIGRTLEKSGCSVLSFEPKTLVEVAERVRERVVNEIGVLVNSPAEVFQRMVVGFLHLMRSYGAFNDPVFHAFIQSGGRTYMLSNDWIKWLPGLRAGRNTPRFIYKPNEKMSPLWNFDLLTEHSKYASWIEACIDEPWYSRDILAPIAQIILDELVRKRIVITMQSPSSYTVYAIDKASVYVSTRVRQFVCDQCGAGISASEENSVFWEGAPCTRTECSGHLREDKSRALDYYGKLYSNGDLIRVVAKEHTGLLERDDRERLERNFKKSRAEQKPWDANLLSCTPTLEMGIDIGDLSTVVMCNMPPGQAQYLQRTGRAGRRDGNALTVAVANARPHDLYFYSEPMEMIQGNVEPPKVFLRAPAVLERQFVAFCMDSWIKQGIPERAIPDRVGVCLNNLANPRPDVFPFNFLEFVQSNLSGLFRNFIQMFQGPVEGLDEESIRELESFAKGDGTSESPMHLKVLEVFLSLKEHKDSLDKNKDLLMQMIRELEKKPADPSHEAEIRELKNELGALVEVIRSLKNKNVYNFMTDEGLLPNYAFPEAGIILKAVLIRKESTGEQEEAESRRRYEKLVYEYNRSASSALSEFAPANHFYVEGKKLRINQIDKTTAQSTNWRLCPNCSHAEEDSRIGHLAACPRCGSPAWADAGQVRPMLKVKMVYSIMPYDKAQIEDDSDDRSTVFYLRQLLVDVDEVQDVIKAYKMENDSFTFGYEFVRKAILREINFGEKDIKGERFSVAGVEEVRKGFKVCKHCGYLQTDDDSPKHARTCRARNQRPEEAEPYEECLFLYREFTTEILRVLIPATTLDFERTNLDSFVAAFMLGMKEYFGNVDHLRAAVTEVPVPDAGYRKQYLVIYDTVPGGTGYLKQLLQHERSLVEILEKALAVLENCSCKEDEQKDGCYRCLFAFRQGQNNGQVSRKTAIRLLRLILSGKDRIEPVERLGNVPVNRLFESELERRFIQVLELMSHETRPIHIEKQMVNQKVGYLLKVGDCSWDIEPQVVLDETQGVTKPSRADFVLWPKNRSGGQKPIAIFTDGYAFHKDKCADDTLKREAIRRSNRFRVWTLSWKDIHHVFKHQGDYATATLIPEKMPSGPDIYKPVITAGGVEDLRLDKSSSLELLMRYLEMPDAERHFRVHARALSLALLDIRKMNDRLAFDEWFLKIRQVLDQVPIAGIDNFKMMECVFGTWSPRSTGSHLHIYAGVKVQDLQQNSAVVLPVVCAVLNDRIEDRTDRFEADWNGFWHFYNVMQFSDHFAGVTTTGIEQMVYDGLSFVTEAAASGPEIQPSLSEEWSEVLEQLFDEEASELVSKLQSAGARRPSACGYELQDDRGMIVAICEMAWEQERVAALLKDQIDHREAFERAGWVVFTVDDEIPASILGGNP